MNTITYAVLENDDHCIDTLDRMAEKVNGLFKEVTFSEAPAALQWMSNNPLDLLFVNAEIPGLAPIKSLIKKPDLIFISEHKVSAVEAFDFSAVDFLMKPIDNFIRFKEAVGKVIKKAKKAPLPVDKSLYVRTNSLLQKIKVDDVSWIEAYGDYIRIQTKDKNHVVYATLKKIHEKLPMNKFIRVHRSFIINLTKITNIDSTNLEIDNKIIPISGSFKENLLNKISIL